MNVPVIMKNILILSQGSLKYYWTKYIPEIVMKLLSAHEIVREK